MSDTILQEPKIESIKTENQNIEVKKENQTTDEKLFNQDFLNAKIGEVKKAEREKLLKELGIEDVTNIKESLRLFKEEQDKKKTEEQRLREQIENLSKEKTEIMNKAQFAEAKFIAISKGVPSEKVERIIKIAQTYEGDDINEKMELTIKDFPEFVKQTNGIIAPPNVGTKTINQNVNDEERMLKEMRAAMNLK